MELDVVFCLAYFLTHLGVYLLFLRRSRSFRREAIIFRYHASGFLVSSVILMLWLVTGTAGASFPGVALGTCLNAIYSLSFLELWALTKTGYSLRILATIARPGRHTTQRIVAVHRHVSDDKKLDRLRSVLTLGLVARRGAHYSLTRRGRCVAAFLGCVAVLAGTSESG